MSTVTIYTTATCIWCALAKNFLEDKRVSYREVDVSDDAKAAMEMVGKSGQLGVPVIDVGGEVIVGFDKEAIVSLLVQKGYT